MREFAARGTHDALRDALPRGGRRLADRVGADGPRRESWPTGRRPRSRRWSATRTIRATLPGAALDALEAPARREPRRPPRRGGRARLHRLRRGDPGAARPLPRRARHRDQRRRRSRRRSSSSPATANEEARAMNAHLSYTRYELLRTLPEPALLRLLARLPARPLLPDRRPEPATRTTSAAPGSRRPLYFMVGLAAFGTMNAMLASAARGSPASARSAGTASCGSPRSAARAYFRAKVVTALPDGGAHARVLVLGGRLARRQPHAPRVGAHDGLILVGLLPFAALGIVLGHLLTRDSIGPAIGGTTALLALLGGTWFPIDERRAADDRPSRCRRTGSCRQPTSPSAGMGGRRPGGRSWRRGRSAGRCLQGGRIAGTRSGSRSPSRSPCVLGRPRTANSRRDAISPQGIARERMNSP